MQTLRIAALAAAAMFMTACATLIPIAGAAVDVLGTASPAVTTAGNKVVLEGTRGLIVAHNAYQGASGAVAPFIAAKRLPPATVDRVEKLSNRAVFLLEQGDKGMTIAQRAAGVFAIADDLNRIIGR